MGDNVKERTIEFVKAKGMTMKHFEEKCGLSSGYVTSMRKGYGIDKLNNVLIAFPELNRDWLLYGEGKMLRQPEGCINQSLSNVRNAIVAAGDNTGNLTIGDTSTHKAEQYGYSIAPIVPREITRLPDLDVLDYIQGKDNVAQSPVIIKDVPVSMWYMVEDDALSPKFLTGDMVALLSTQKGMVNFVPGRVYAVDTNSRGILLRILFEQGKDLRTHSLNSEAHPDFVIKHNDVIRIYKVLAMYRFNN